MMRSRDFKWKRIALVALPLLMISVALFALSQKRRAIVELFAPVPGTEGCRFVAGSMWRSEWEVVCLSAPTSINDNGLSSVNAQSGKRKALAPQVKNLQISGNFGVIVSPDGKWLLWPDGMSGWNAMSLDGKRFVQRPRASNNLSDLEVAWLPDSSGWVEAREDETPDGTIDGMQMVKTREFLRICRINVAKIQEIDVPKASSINDFQVTQKGEAVFSCAEPVSVRFVFVPLSDPSKLRELDIEPPFNAGNQQHVMGTLVSPRGDRIAWTSQIMSGGNVTESVWLSDIDGKNFTRLTPELRKQDLAPVYLHWKPDGKSLSFWRGNKLWVIKIP